jgi:[ribosomal protein S5]-alanine N-acetyltransferase
MSEAISAGSRGKPINEATTERVLTVDAPTSRPPAKPILRRVPPARVITERIELRPLPALAAAVLPDDREEASRIIRATLPAEWPLADLLDVLPLQAAASPETERFGIWLMIERDSVTIVGDIGFIGPPDASGSVELGFSVLPNRRHCEYATEAARAIVDWALSQPGVEVVVASCESDNTPSIRTLESAGFRRTGEAGGQIRWRCDRLVELQ